jgi:hypothetical protein
MMVAGSNLVWENNGDGFAKGSARDVGVAKLESISSRKKGEASGDSSPSGYSGSSHAFSSVTDAVVVTECIVSRELHRRRVSGRRRLLRYDSVLEGLRLGAGLAGRGRSLNGCEKFLERGDGFSGPCLDLRGLLLGSGGALASIDMVEDAERIDEGFCNLMGGGAASSESLSSS